ncbi:hypothetical protein Tco_0199071 [Tanacetum coccineum]
MVVLASKTALTSYSCLVFDPRNRKENFHMFETSIPTSDKVDVQIPMSSVLEANAWFKNLLYGYFLGKRATFPVIEHYDSLSAMATKLGKPMMLDAYTSSTFLQSWGRLNFVRALIDLRVDQALKSSMVIAVSTLKGKEYILHTIRIEYE